MPPVPPPDFWTWLTAGNAPGYLTGLVAAVALIFAVKSSNASHRSAKAAQAQLERLQDEDRSKQASQLRAWATSLSHMSWTEDREHGDYKYAYGVEVAIGNSSGQPLHALFFYTYGQQRFVQLGTLLLLPPHDGLTYMACSFVGEADLKLELLSIGVIFRDSAGRTWNRDPGGGLKEVTEEEALRISGRITSFSQGIADRIPFKGNDRNKLFAFARSTLR